MDVKVSVKEVGRLIGGNVQRNIDMPAGGFQNACPIRMSYVLNKTGSPIRKSPRYATVSGADQLQYLYRVDDMIQYLADVFGAPELAIKNPATSHFQGRQGIIVVKGRGWSNARGHVSLWNGARCADSCHLMHDPDNGPFVPDSGSLWTLR